MNSWNTEPDRDSLFESLAGAMKALANGHRLELVELLAQGEHSVDALARMARLGVTTASAHLQTLKRAGLVLTRRAGTTVYYRLADGDVAEVFVAAKRMALRHVPGLRDELAAFRGTDGADVIHPADVTDEMAVIDIRAAAEYDAGHFPGAVSIPHAELADRVDEVPTDRTVVLYCRGEFCRRARTAAVWLAEQGVRAKAMDEGAVDWRASGDVDLHVA